ncbi:MAG: isocitrate/isopropylmalate family dehydrogenase [Alphaproteobacteria bacterium]
MRRVTGRPLSRSLAAAVPGFSPRARTGAPVIGVLPGEGVGPEVMDAALRVVKTAAAQASVPLEIRTGGLIGAPAKRSSGKALSDEVADFCASVFADGGAILCGPGGARFVYDLRTRFGLYCKLTPLWPSPSLADAGPLRQQARSGADIVVVRENVGGIYLGRWDTCIGPGGETVAIHEFRYGFDEVVRILDAGIALAGSRTGRLCVVNKREGMPSISKLWESALGERTRSLDLDVRVLDIDNAAYQIVANARAFDVVVAPNMLGDILSDTAALLLGSRGMSFSGNFGDKGLAVYQTGHGAAHDLAGTGKANPVGQILSAVMMLRDSFGLDWLAARIEDAVESTLASGIRTADIAAPGGAVVGTREMGDRIAQALAEQMTRRATPA